MRHALRPLLVACFFVCPLIFFTNLTRNPYITQICLLNGGLLLAGAAMLWEFSASGRRALPRTPLDAPLAAWTAVCALSWGVAFALHRPFFRPSMASEGARAFLFLAANMICPFYLAAWTCGDACDGEVEVGPWAAFALIWGALWLAFPAARGPAAAAASDIFGHVWDGYGFCLWAGGFAAALWLCRRGRWGDFLHLALTSAFLASMYGVLQYFNKEIIWPSTLNPYGGRSVSTFGNPNFMSSFMVMLLPVALALFSRSKGGRRAVYATLALSFEAALLCSLTRSSWAGAAAALAILLLSPEFRRAVAADPRPHGLLAATAAAMVLSWPSSSIGGGYTPSVLGRLAEVVAAAHAYKTYSSFFQRVLIWTCGWLMGAENPLTGKGHGLFELFYPFYQGHVLSVFEAFQPMRTHANNSHNEIVEVWAQTGLMGLGVFFWIWAAFFASARRWFGRAAERSTLLAACAAGVAGMLVDNMLNVSLHFAVPAFLFWWVAGTCMGGLNPAPAKPEGRLSPASVSWRWGFRAAAALLASLSWVWVCVWFREAHYFAGFKLLRQQSYPSAVKELERSFAWGPREVNAIYELGNAYARSERYSDAERTYHEALGANAGYDEIYYNIGALNASRLGRPERAVDYFRISQWINPLARQVYTSLGNIYLSSPQLFGDDGLSLLKEAVRFFPDDANHWNNLGYLLALRRRWPESESAYARALSIDPGLTQAALNLESVARQSGRPRAKILESLDRLRELESRVAKQDFSEQTLALAQRLDRELPDSLQTRFFLGSLFVARGKPGQAVPPLAWVVSRQPNHISARLNLGEAYLALRQTDDALAQFQAVSTLDPANPRARQRLRELAR